MICSCVISPSTAIPIRPLPRGSLSSHASAGESYHNICSAEICVGAGVGAGAGVDDAVVGAVGVVGVVGALLTIAAEIANAASEKLIHLNFPKDTDKLLLPQTVVCHSELTGRYLSVLRASRVFFICHSERAM